MGRSQAKARKALKDKQALDILRDRDRKLSGFDRLLPPDAETPPARILRSNITSHQLPARSPPSEPRTTKIKRIAKQADRIEKRAQLMSIKATDVVDLTNIDPDIDTDTPVEDNKSFVLQNDFRSFNVSFSIGFRGYSKQTTGHCKSLFIQCLQSSPTFQMFVHRILLYQLQTMGLNNRDIEISGYEVRFLADCVYGDITIHAGQRVLVRSSDILVAWANQAIDDNSGQLPEIVVRIVKSNGAIFDTTFRTAKEKQAEPIAPDDSIEPGMQDTSSAPTPKLTKRGKQRRQTLRTIKCGLTQDKNQGDARREKLARKALLKHDMILLERMMARQYLSDGNTHRPVRVASCLSSRIPQQSDGKAHTESQVKHVQVGEMDLDMD